MRGKDSVFSTTMAGVSLVLFGYVLFISVFNQIITQNEGFFYMIVFGGILVLAFILLSLITKLLAISHEVEERKLWYVTEAVSVLALYVLFFRTRLAYTSSLPAQDAVFYKAAVLLEKQMLSVGGMDILPQLMRNPAQYAYSVVVWLVFLLTGASPSIIVYINMAVLFLTVFFVYRIVRRIGGRVCGILSVACSLFMPSQAFTVYSYNTELFFACILFAALSVLVCLFDRGNEKKRLGLPLYGLFGALLGMLIFTEPLAVIIAVLLLIGILRSQQKGWLRALVSVAAMLVVFVALFFIKCDSLECTSGELLQAYAGRFSFTSNMETGEQYEAGQIISSFHVRLDSQNAPIADNYYFLTKGDGQTYSALQAAWFQLGNQLLYLFLIVLSIACAYYVIKGKNPQAVPCLLALIGAVGVLFLGTDKESNTYFFVELLIITGCVSLHYLYENYHPKAEPALTASDPSHPEDGAVEEETEEEREIQLARARALVFIGENNALYEEIKAQEKGSQTLVLKTLRKSVNEIMTEEAEKDSEETIEIAENKENIENMENVLKKDKPAEIMKPKEPEKEAETNAAITKEAGEKEPMKEKKKAIKFLENPLPLPKPHVSKTMDYSLGMETDQDFDIEIGEDDDFEV